MTDGPWLIPESWAWATTGQIAQVVGGGTPRTEDPANFEGGDVPWITPADLSGYTDKFISRGARNITRSGLESSGARLMPAGTVLFSSRAPIGYVAIASNPVSTNQGFKSFILPMEISPDFAYYYLQRARSLAVDLSSGTTFREISGAKAALIPFPLVPFREQRLIVAEIEKQFTRLDAAVAALKRVQANLKRNRAAVLKAAVEGRLVPTEAELARREGRSYEPASELLKRILAERRARWEAAQLAKFRASGKEPKDDKWKAKYPEPEGPDTSSLPPLSEGWIWAAMPQLGELNRGKSKHRPRDDASLFGGPYPFIQTGEVKHSGGYIRNHSQTYNETGLAQSRLWPAGTLCITIAANIAESGILTYPACFPDSVVGFVTDEPAELVRFVQLFLNTAKAELARFAPATAQKNINLETLSSLAVPLPPTSEQSRIVAEGERRLSVIDELEMQLDADLKRAERLRQAILKRAFEGKLVPQDPTDEPASVLLERVRAEREMRQGKAPVARQPRSGERRRRPRAPRRA